VTRGSPVPGTLAVPGLASVADSPVVVEARGAVAIVLGWPEVAGCPWASCAEAARAAARGDCPRGRPAPPPEGPP
jgi:hypothetical protein